MSGSVCHFDCCLAYRLEVKCLVQLSLFMNIRHVKKGIYQGVAYKGSSLSLVRGKSSFQLSKASLKC